MLEAGSRGGTRPPGLAGSVGDLDVAEQERGAEFVDGDFELAPLGAILAGPGAGDQGAGDDDPVALLQPGGGALGLLAPDGASR